MITKSILLLISEAEQAFDDALINVHHLDDGGQAQGKAVVDLVIAAEHLLMASIVLLQGIEDTQVQLTVAQCVHSHLLDAQLRIRALKAD